MSIYMICCHRQIVYSVIRGYKCGKILVLDFKERDYLAGLGVDGSIILTLLLSKEKTNLMPLILLYIQYSFNTQHVSAVNTTIFRSLSTS